MIPKLVTFDCAGTLVEVPPGWTLGQFAVNCANHIGLSIGEGAAETYQSLYMARIMEFVHVNMARDTALQTSFWTRLATDWLNAIQMPTDRLVEMQDAADELGFGPNSIVFSLYDDVVECLDRLEAMGVQLAVISNWDYSLHRVLRMFGLYERFIVVTASLEEGVEKPDPRLFEITLSRAGFEPKDVLHVGDDPVDDIQGAEAAGIRSIKIDRSVVVSEYPVIKSLLDLPEALAWTA